MIGYYISNMCSAKHQKRAIRKLEHEHGKAGGSNDANGASGLLRNLHKISLGNNGYQSMGSQNLHRRLCWWTWWKRLSCQYQLQWLRSQKSWTQAS